MTESGLPLAFPLMFDYSVLVLFLRLIFEVLLLAAAWETKRYFSRTNDLQTVVYRRWPRNPSVFFCKKGVLPRERERLAAFVPGWHDHQEGGLRRQGERLCEGLSLPKHLPMLTGPKRMHLFTILVSPFWYMFPFLKG